MDTNLINEIKLEVIEDQVKITGKTETTKQVIAKDKPYFEGMERALTYTLNELITDYRVQKRWAESDYNG